MKILCQNQSEFDLVRDPVCQDIIQGSDEVMNKNNKYDVIDPDEENEITNAKTKTTFRPPLTNLPGGGENSAFKFQKSVSTLLILSFCQILNFVA